MGSKVFAVPMQPAFEWLQLGCLLLFLIDSVLGALDFYGLAIDTSGLKSTPDAFQC